MDTKQDSTYYFVSIAGQKECVTVYIGSVLPNSYYHCLVG